MVAIPLLDAWSTTLLLLLSTIAVLLRIFWLKPKVLRFNFQMQGITGPLPSFVVGNLPEMKKILSTVSLPENQCQTEVLTEDPSSTVFPYFKHWAKQYGSNFIFALGRTNLLYVTNLKTVKELNIFKSLDLGKPSYLQKDRGPLLGKGLITTSGAVWVHQRKTIAPELYMDKLKGKMDLYLEAAGILVKSWDKIIEEKGGTADILVDDYVRMFTSHVISKLLFGNDYHKGIELLPKCRSLIKAMGRPTILSGVPFSRFIPTKRNKEIWRLEKEIRSMILNIGKGKRNFNPDNILDVLIHNSKNGELGPSTADDFVVDNCKDIYLAGFEVSGIAAIWGLMLLAAHPEWQNRVRDEVFEVCGGRDVRLLDNNKLTRMKMLKMVIQEVLRLFPGVAFVSREALQDVTLGEIRVPKDMNIWIWMLALHRDLKLWGPDANKFNPERFANGVSGACNSPQAYIPFGVGARVCPGQYLSIVEMKVLFATILSKFDLTISPSYRHAPQFGLLLEPKYGVNLMVRKI